MRARAQSVNKKTLEKLAITDQREQCEAAGVAVPFTTKLTPLQVMLANMEWAIKRAEEAAQKIDRAEGIKDLVDAVKELARYRTLSQSFAKDAAPYVHSKLTATAPAPTDGEQANVIDHEPYRGRFDHVLDVFRAYQGEPAKG